MSDPAFTKTPSDVNALLARGFFYYLVASLFRHPQSGANPRTFIESSERGWAEALDLLPLERKNMFKERFHVLEQQIRSIDEESWIREYDSCLGHTAQAKAPAYELEYGEEHSHRQPAQLADIAAFYQAFGVRVAQESHERVDHVSVECEFMYFMLLKEAYARRDHGEEKAEIVRRASEKFFTEHLGSWFPGFLTRLLRFASCGLMKEIAEFSLFFITEEARSQGWPLGSADMPIRAVQDEEYGCVSCTLRNGLSEGR